MKVEREKIPQEYAAQGESKGAETRSQLPDAYNISEEMCFLKTKRFPARIAVAWLSIFGFRFRFEKAWLNNTFEEDDIDVIVRWLREAGSEGLPKERTNKTHSTRYARCVVYLTQNEWRVWKQSKVSDAVGCRRLRIPSDPWVNFNPFRVPEWSDSLCSPASQPLSQFYLILFTAVKEAAELYCEARRVFPDFETIFVAAQTQKPEPSSEVSVAIILNSVKSAACDLNMRIRSIESETKSGETPHIHHFIRGGLDPSNALRLGLHLGRSLADARAILSSAPYYSLMVKQGRSDQKLSTFWRWVLDQYAATELKAGEVLKKLKRKQNSNTTNLPFHIDEETKKIKTPENGLICDESFKRKYRALSALWRAEQAS